MKLNIPSYRIFPLGDAALTIVFGNVIDPTINRLVLALFARLKKESLPGLKEAVPAYSSVTLYYDILQLRSLREPGATFFDAMKKQAEQLLLTSLSVDPVEERRMTIPACYDPSLGIDIELLARSHNMRIEDLIDLHTSREYRVFMLGFLPGFAYMGEVDERISGVRKTRPATVQPGSIGIAGRQTGIYPVRSPGGWQIIGRTPLIMFNAAEDEPALLRAGDIIQFKAITLDEFARY